MSKNLALLLDLASDLPEGLRADWKGTNHYEMTAPTDDDGYFWLIVDDFFHLDWAEAETPRDTTVTGERLGLLMDIAAVLKAAEPELKRLFDDE